MDAAPTFAPQTAPEISTGPSFWQRPLVANLVGGLAVLGGIAAGLAALVAAGLVAVLGACTADATGLCTNYAGLVPVLEWAIVSVGFVAPTAGGLASCVRREWRWLPLGVAVAAAMTALMFAVAAGQTGTLS